MSLTLGQLEFLRSPAAAELLAMDLPADPFHAVQTLRKHCTGDQAAAVQTLRELRRRAKRSGRFPEDFARRMLATDTLGQQASSLRLAVWMGRKLARLAGEAKGEVLDLCCGLGADTIGLARAHLRVCGYDAAPEAALCAAHNAAVAGVGDRCRFEVADAAAVDIPGGGVVHIDPDRRSRGRRGVDLDDCSPGPAFLRALRRRTAAGAMKLSPVLRWDDLDDLRVGQWEYVSEHGVCKQLVGWWGGEATGDRTPRAATVVAGPHDEPHAVSIAAGEAPYAPVREAGEWLIEPDPAVIAADAVDDLAAAHGLWRIQPGLCWLFGDGPVETPLAHAFHVLEAIPGRERDVARALRRLDAGEVEVKTRGVKLDTDGLQKRLRGRGPRALAVLWCRIGPKQRVFLCERARP